MKNLTTYILTLLSLLTIVSCGYNDATLRPNIIYNDPNYAQVSLDSKVYSKLNSSGVYEVILLQDGQESVIGEGILISDDDLNFYAGDGFTAFTGTRVSTNEKVFYSYNGQELKENSKYSKFTHIKSLNNQYYLVGKNTSDNTSALVKLYYGELRELVKFSTLYIAEDYKGVDTRSTITSNDLDTLYIASTKQVVSYNVETEEFGVVKTHNRNIDTITYWQDELVFSDGTLYFGINDVFTQEDDQYGIMRIDSKSEDYLVAVAYNSIRIYDTSFNRIQDIAETNTQTRTIVVGDDIYFTKVIDSETKLFKWSHGMEIEEVSTLGSGVRVSHFVKDGDQLEIVPTSSSEESEVSILSL